MFNWKLFLHYQRYSLPYLRKIILSLSASLIGVFLGLIAPLITRALIDYVYPNKDLGLLTFLVICGLAIFFLEQFFENVSDYLDMYIENDLMGRLRGQFFNRLQKFSLTFHHSRHVGDLMFRINENIELAVSLIVQLIPVLIQTAFQFIFLLVICFHFDWQLTLLALSGIPLYVLETRFFAKRRKEITEKEFLQQAEITSYLQEKIPSIKMIKSFNRQETEAQTFKKKIMLLFQIVRQQHIIKFFNTFTDASIKTVWLAVLGWYAGYRVITGALTIGEVIAIMIYVSQIYGPIMQLGNIFHFSVEGMVSIKRIDEILNHKEDTHEEAGFEEFKIAQGSLRFENVSFSYGFGNFSLKNICLDIDPNCSVVIVGPSGCGKTTLIDLILRFYVPSAGRIFVDGKDMMEVNIDSLREQIGLVSQEVNIFHGSINDNISYGKKGASFEDIVRAAKRANAHEFIERLPEKYETILEERGLNLSGGQRQRITIARALIRNPKILILDEATSAIDPESESYIHEALNHLKASCTIISVAHRSSMIIGSDQVVFVDKGEIVESGSFKSLMDQRGKFCEFYEKEFSNFHFFSDRLQREISRSKRYKRPLSLLMLEVSNAEQIISVIGRKQFNKVLEDTSSLIYKRIRSTDFVALYQKERYLICLPETDLEKAQLNAQRIKKILNAHVYAADVKQTQIHYKVGIATLDDQFSAEALFRDCEKMLKG